MNSKSAEEVRFQMMEVLCSVEDWCQVVAVTQRVEPEWVAPAQRGRGRREGLPANKAKRLASPSSRPDIRGRIRPDE
jgi:hypothetical protein